MPEADAYTYLGIFEGSCKVMNRPSKSTYQLSRPPLYLKSPFLQGPKPTDSSRSGPPPPKVGCPRVCRPVEDDGQYLSTESVNEESNKFSHVPQHEQTATAGSITPPPTNGPELSEHDFLDQLFARVENEKLQQRKMKARCTFDMGSCDGAPICHMFQLLRRKAEELRNNDNRALPLPNGKMEDEKTVRK